MDAAARGRTVRQGAVRRLRPVLMTALVAAVGFTPLLPATGPGSACCPVWRRVMTILGSIGLFVLAGLCEIGGGYLVWQWWRNGASWTVGVFGGLVLFLYGVVPTYQPAHFGRVYAAYGGWFIVLSLIWGWAIDHIEPDRYDLLGAGLCLAGVALIMYWPR